MAECITATPDVLGNYWEDPAFRPIVDASLVLWLTSDFGNSGTWTDLSGKGNHGSIHGATRTPVHPLGIFGSAVSFNGTDNYVDCGNDSSLDLTTFTWSLWIYLTTTPDLYDIIIGNVNKAGDGARLWYYDSVWNFSLRNSSTDRLYLNGNPPVLNTWTHIVVISTGSHVYFYENGNEVNNDSFSFTLGAQCQTMLGAMPDTTPCTGTMRFFSGIIGEVCVYNRTLSPTEVMYNYTHSPIYYIQRGLI